MRAGDPERPAADMAQELGLSRERVRQHLIALGLPTRGRRGATGYRRSLFRAAPALRPTTYRLRAGHRKRKGRVGAAGELSVAVDLMARGWDVFRSLAPDAPFDLAAWDGARFLRLEVKASTSQPSRSRSPRYDVLAWVQASGAVTYQPAVPVVRGV